MGDGAYYSPILLLLLLFVLSSCLWRNYHILFLVHFLISPSGY